MAVDVGVGGDGGGPEVPDGHGRRREGLHAAGVRLPRGADRRRVRSVPEGHAHAVVSAAVACMSEIVGFNKATAKHMPDCCLVFFIKYQTLRPHSVQFESQIGEITSRIDVNSVTHLRV